MRRKMIAFWALLVAVALALSACAQAPSPTKEASPKVEAPTKGRKGGTIKIALWGDPVSIDCPTSTSTDVYGVGWHIAEQLFTFGEKYEVIPMLVDRYEVTPDGLNWKFHLRQGVLFHNLKEMTSEDVVASIERYFYLSGPGKEVAKIVTSVKATSKYLVEMSLKERSGGLLVNLATPGAGCFIYPKEAIDASRDKDGKYARFPETSYIGTGPYQFVEWRRERHIKLKRFEKYCARNDPGPNGFGGRKEAYADELIFVPVPDTMTRLAGLQAGDFDLTILINQEDVGRAKAAGLQVNVVKPAAWLMFSLNMKEGPFTSKVLRQAFLASLDMGPIMEAAIGDKEYYRLDPGIAQKEQSDWYTTAGGEAYNKPEPEKAKRLMQEAGYKGTPLRWILDQDQDWYRRSAIVAIDQLKKLGWNIEYFGMDRGSYSARRGQSNQWEIGTTNVSPKYDPMQIT
ncbi:MAG: ABC transporter substrate-binding protein, partial [Bacillota bacterium]|nr:ABC transporter substrate-binding protein [Bacillota bacterium]